MPTAWTIPSRVSRATRGNGRRGGPASGRPVAASNRPLWQGQSSRRPLASGVTAQPRCVHFWPNASSVALVRPQQQARPAGGRIVERPYRADGDFIDLGDRQHRRRPRPAAQQVPDGDAELADAERRAGQHEEAREGAARHVLVLRRVDGEILRQAGCCAAGRPSGAAVRSIISSGITPRPPPCAGRRASCPGRSSCRSIPRS